MIGRVVWQVVSREAGDKGIWEPDILKDPNSHETELDGTAVTVALNT